MLVCVTGVSGSGKSTLIHDCLYAGLKKQRGEWQGHVGAFQKLEGGQFIDDVILVDQSPIGRTPRSNPVTYIKVYDAIREVFSGRVKHRRAVRSVTLLFQFAGRALRGLPGRRHGHWWKCSFSPTSNWFARSARDALQATDSRHSLSRQERSRSAEHDRA